MMKTLLKVGSVIQIARRGALRPSRNIPYFGLYRKEGETVQQDELLVSQRNYNYHPGANVSFFINIMIISVDSRFITYLTVDVIY